MENLTIRITGTAPLLMQAEVLANPLHPLTKAHKAVSGKRKKSEDDYTWLMESEWSASMYFDDKLGPYLPSVNVEGCLSEAGRITRLGKVIKQAAMVVEDKIKLEYTGPRDKAKMWEKNEFRDVRGVNVGGKKIMRCRPLFLGWSGQFSIAYMEDVLDRDNLVQVLETAGRRIGIGTFRPRFGRFAVEVLS